MALSDRWTRLQFRTAARRELLDPNARWWTNDELNGFVQDWTDWVQDEYELVWGSATVTSSLSTYTLTAVASDARRLGRVYFNNVYVPTRSKEELEIFKREWKTATNSSGPVAVYQDDSTTFSYYPPLTTSGTTVVEYPTLLTYTTDTSTCPLPAWTRFSARSFIAYRAYLKAGPNQDLRRAARYRAKAERALRRCGRFFRSFFPERYQQLRPAGKFEGGILRPPRPLEGLQ